MYVVTFYSFKGGVGRSMALANVAAELLKRGRTVLMVDFDLEAPGLDTFPISLSRPITQGLVEMIADYLRADGGDTPAVEDYLYSATIDGVSQGSLWLMPSGRQDSTYESRFRSIDWQNLYEQESGFLFFEDLKLQWQEVICPDYVLIDSRTGHTDIGGICTRQLADCVVAVFFPNEQNLRGLAPVVADVRAEERGALQKRIDLHFVMSNVPDLDDEDEILSRASRRAQEALGYGSLTATIHYFSSLAMLDQKLMILERPKSQVATEYRQLASGIAKGNLKDRDGALAVLDQALDDLRAEVIPVPNEDLERKIRDIRDHHSIDVEILRRIGRFRRTQRRIEEALETYDQVLQLRPDDAESLVAHADILTTMGKTSLATEDLLKFFNLRESSPVMFALATRLLIANGREQLGNVLQSPVLRTLPFVMVMDMLQDLQKSYETALYAVEILNVWRKANPVDEDGGMLSHFLSIALIAVGSFREAQAAIMSSSSMPLLSLVNKFNYAMAEWGASGRVPRELFAEMLAEVSEPEMSTDANRLQAMSLIYWANDKLDVAHRLLELAEVAISRAPRTVFSAWSYLYRAPRKFREDLEAMRTLYKGTEVAPAFMPAAPLFDPN